MEGQSSETSAAPAEAPKFLRYRSIRGRALKNPEPDGPPPPPLPPPLTSTSQTSLTRLPSRYRRQAKPITEVPAQPPVPQVSHVYSPTAHAPPSAVPEAPEVRNEASQYDYRRQPSEPEGHRVIIGIGQWPSTREPENRVQDRSHKSSSGTQSWRPEDLSGSQDSPSAQREILAGHNDAHLSQVEKVRRSREVAREEARLALQGEVGRLQELRRQEAQRRQQRGHTLGPHAGLHDWEQTNTPEHKRKVSRSGREVEGGPGHISERTDSATKAPIERTFSVADKAKPRTLVIGGPFQLQQERQQQPPSTDVDNGRLLGEHHPRSRSLDTQEEKQPRPPPGVVSNFDAPVSAVNAGERQVSVQWNGLATTLPVTPSTTCKDVLRSASVCVSESIDARTAVLLESFSQLGLERPLRRYERIRDVMNSWDGDGHNHLLILPESVCAARGLHEEEAPREPPSAAVVHVYHSQKPGKWDKRWLKVREDGQVTMSKNEHGVVSSKICHLSDFDVYTPTSSQMKKLKPPKKICFALKSQERSSMFLDAANFVHFFCTKDKDVAERLYNAVHSWRSWYLYNMLGEIVHKPTSRSASGIQSRPSTNQSKRSWSQPSSADDWGTTLMRPSIEAPNLHADSIARPSQGDVPRPLLDLIPDRHSPSAEGRPKTPRHSGKAQAPPPPPPTAYPRKFMIESARSAAVPGHGEEAEEKGPFTGSGLLARSASRRAPGGGRSGRAASGAGASKPLVDLQLTSEFTDGSLLREMEVMAAQKGALEPKIDRQKRTEVKVSVGEGFA